MNPARRQFLQKLFRHGAAAGLVAGAGALVVLPQTPNPECIQPLRCGQCTRLRACGLPKADRYRKLKGGADDGPLA